MPQIDVQGNFNILEQYLYLYMAIKAWKAYTLEVLT